MAKLVNRRNCEGCPAADFGIFRNIGRGICRLDPGTKRRIKRTDWCIQNPVRMAEYRVKISNEEKRLS